MYVELAMVAASVGMQLLIPKPKQVRTRSQIPTIPKAEPSAALAEVYGKDRVAGHFFYSTEPYKIRKTSTVGKGAPQSVIDEIIKVDLMGFALACNEPVNLVELNLNGEVVYSRDTLNSNLRLKSDTFFNDHIIFFDGSPGQPVSTDLINAEGTSNLSSFPYMSYILLKDITLNDYGTNYPTVTAVLESKADYSNLKLFFDRIIERSGVNSKSSEIFNVNVLSVSENLRDIPFYGGSFVLDGSDYFSWISNLIEFWQLTLVESNNGIYTLDVPVNIYGDSNNVTVIDAKEVVGLADGDAYKITNSSIEFIPNQLAVNYKDRNMDYDTSTVTVNIDKSGLTNARTFDFPFVMNRGNALSGASRLLRGSWTKKQTLTFTVPSQFDVSLRLGSIIRFTNNEQLEGIFWLIQNVTIGDNGFMEIVAQVINPGTWAYVSNVSNVPASDVPGDGSYLADSQLSLQISDTSLTTTEASNRVNPYVTATSEGFNGTTYVYSSTDDTTYTFLTTLDATSFGAVLVSTLPVSSPYVPDYTNTITIQLLDSTKGLTSVTDTEAAQGARILAVGKELIGYTSVSQLSANTWELSGLYRGMYDTESFIATHSAGERAAIIKELSFVSDRLDLDLVDRGSLYFKISTVSNPDLLNLPSLFLNFEANGAKALAPVILKPIRQANNDWVISYVPRSANRGNFIIEDNVARSSNPDGNRFDILIYDTSLTLLRTVTIDGTSYTYTSANQIADNGSVLTNIVPVVFQQSLQENAGRGYEGIAI